MNIIEIELSIMIDADGDWAVLDNDEGAHETFEAVVGSSPTNPTRIITVKLSVPTPEPVTVSAILPAELLPSVPVTLTVS